MPAATTWDDIDTVWRPPIPEEEWTVYRRVLHNIREAGVPFAIGGGFAMSAYTGLWRHTKDLDVYVTPEHRQAAIEALSRAGLRDYFDVLAYDRKWIYRGHTEETIVDVIWAMANQRAQVDDAWIRRGPTVNVHGESLALVPPEEMLWAKLYIIQRERCDWPDTLNLVYALGPDLDWSWLVKRVDDDLPLLDAMLRVFAWLCPDLAQRLPRWLFEMPGLPAAGEQIALDVTSVRAARLDTRPWFGRTREPDTRSTAGPSKWR